MESGIAIRCLDLFTQFPFNNLLHHRVRYCIIASMPTLQQVIAFCCANYLQILKDYVFFGSTPLSMDLLSLCLLHCCVRICL